MSTASAVKSNGKAQSSNYLVLRDFGCTYDSVSIHLRAGQRLSMASDAHIIPYLLQVGAPIELEGNRTMDQCPKCGHVYACGLER